MPFFPRPLRRIALPMLAGTSLGAFTLVVASSLVLTTPDRDHRNAAEPPAQRSHRLQLIPLERPPATPQTTTRQPSLHVVAIGLPTPVTGPELQP